jgi:23S rRNA pseudouridine2605 synthase
LGVRLNKYLADRGIAARRKCDEMIADGRVSVNGRVVREMGTKVEERDKVAVDGRPVGGSERHVYYVLNKPVGVITTLDDPQGRRTIREFLPRGARVYPVGRLDADTSGLLLLTNDGELAHRLMHPRYGVPKVYRVRLGNEPRADQLRRLGSGVRFDGNQVSGPARVRRIDPGFDAIMIEVTIHEGRFRQVRKMCEAVGLDVTGLHRVGYGPLRLGPMTRGMFRELSDEEVASLRAASARPGGKRTASGTPATERQRGSAAAASERPGGVARDAKRASRAEPAPVAEPRELLDPGTDDEAEEREETWVPGGGYVPRDEDDDAPDESAPSAEEWPARASGRRGDRDWRPSGGEGARPARDRASAPPARERSRPAEGRPRGPRPRPGSAARGPRSRPEAAGRRREPRRDERSPGATARGSRTRSEAPVRESRGSERSSSPGARRPRVQPVDRSRRRDAERSERPSSLRSRPGDRGPRRKPVSRGRSTGPRPGPRAGSRGPRNRPDEFGRGRDSGSRGRFGGAPPTDRPAARSGRRERPERPRSEGARGPKRRSGSAPAARGRPGAGAFAGRSARNPSRRKRR